MAAFGSGCRSDGPRIHQGDDNPISLQHFAESAVRIQDHDDCPTALVLLVADSELAERKIENEKELRIPKLTRQRRRRANGRSCRAAKLLVAAEKSGVVCGPRPLTGRMDLLVELAETLQMPIQEVCPHTTT
jgi:hypothetical protein